jgi:CelD/BcsL family acetyltransferase involved in cellulose biosynthesis
VGLSYRRIAPHELDAGLLEAWRSVQRSHRHLASPYFSPEFTQLVGQVRSDVGVVVVEDASGPVGFFPFQRSWGGLGRPVGGPFSDYHGVIMGADTECDPASLVRAAGLSVWVFDHVPAAMGWFEPHAWARAGSPIIDLSGGYAAYAERFRASGSDYVTRAQRLSRKIEREIGPLTFSLHEDSDVVIQQVFDWKDAKYLESRPTAVFRDHPWTGALLRAVVRTQASGFAGVCSVLRVGGRVIAAHLGMRAAGVLHWWFPTFDVTLDKYSPGTLLLLRIAEAAQAAGISVIDLGKGDSRYKLTAMTGTVPLLEGAVELPSWRTRWRRLQRAIEARSERGGLLARGLNVALRALRRREYLTKFR